MPRRLLLALCLAAAPRGEALEIVFTDIGPSQGHGAMSAQAMAGFEAAAALWESLLVDPVTVNIGVATYNFGAGNSRVIGQAGSTAYAVPYPYLPYTLYYDQTSLTDVAVLSQLPSGDTYTRRINLATDLANPAIPVLAASDTFMVNAANAKALGFTVGAASDATIEFNSAYAFDYNRADGIAAGQVDFIGVAAHEIGHALGFISIVDEIDYGAATLASAISTPMDFLRHSFASLPLGVHDVSIDNQARFLLIGELGILMSTGTFNGDGQQASHFLDNAGLGMMDPTASNGELRTFTGYDLVVMDAIGWDLSPEALALAAAAMSQIPEPSSVGLGLGAGALALAAVARRRRGKKTP